MIKQREGAGLSRVALTPWCRPITLERREGRKGDWVGRPQTAVKLWESSEQLHIRQKWLDHITVLTHIPCTQSLARAAGGVHVLSSNTTTDPQHCKWRVSAHCTPEGRSEQVYFHGCCNPLAEEVQTSLQFIPMEENTHQPCYVYCRPTVYQRTC